MRSVRAVLIGTLVVGTLDLLDAFIFFGLRNGTTPIRIGQSIAAGWLGRDSFSRGLASAALGFATHYFIAFGIVLVCVLASRWIPLLARQPLIGGALYGVGAYLVMNLVVIPLSAIGRQPLTFNGPFVNGILIHIFGIGIPSAFAARAARTQDLRP